MSLKRAVKAVGFKDFMKMGLALATSRKMAIAPPPKNEVERCNKVNEINIIGRELSSQFEIFAEVAKNPRFAFSLSGFSGNLDLLLQVLSSD